MRVSKHLRVSKHINIFSLLVVVVSASTTTTTIIIIIIIITKLPLRQYRSNESISVAHLVHGFGNLVVQVQCKIHQQVIGWSGNLSKSKKVNFQMVTERNYAIWWLNMWIPKSRDSNWRRKHESQQDFNPRNTQVKTRWMELSGLGC